MSTRANAIKYRASRSGVGGSGIMPAIGSMFGADSINGGIEVQPDGSFKYVKPEVKHPVLDAIFNRGGASREVGNIRNTIEPTLLFQQEAQKKADALAHLQAILKEQEERLRSELDLKKEDVRHKNTESEAYTQGGVAGALQHGVIPSKSEEVNVAAQALNDSVIRNRLLGLRQNEADMTNPDIELSRQLGKIATNFAPVIANRNAASVDAGPMDNKFISPMDAMPSGLIQDATQITGMVPEQTVIQMPGPIPGIAGPAKTTTSYNPAQIRQPANPSLIERASQMFPSNVRPDVQPDPASSPSASPNLGWFLKYLQSLQQGGPNIGTQPLLQPTY